MVAHRLASDVQLCRDLIRRRASRKQSEHVALARGELDRLGLCRKRWACDEHEHADDLASPREGNRVDLDLTGPWTECSSTSYCVDGTVPTTLLMKASCARRRSAGATNSLKCEPPASPITRRCAWFCQKITPSRSIAYAMTPTSISARSTSASRRPRAGSTRLVSHLGSSCRTQSVTRRATSVTRKTWPNNASSTVSAWGSPTAGERSPKPSVVNATKLK